jgi:hypothetical protein
LRNTRHGPDERRKPPRRRPTLRYRNSPQEVIYRYEGIRSGEEVSAGLQKPATFELYESSQTVAEQAALALQQYDVPAAQLAGGDALYDNHIAWPEGGQHAGPGDPQTRAAELQHLA